MKVLHVGNAFDGGGAENVFAHSLTALRARETSDVHLSAFSASLSKQANHIPHLDLTSWSKYKHVGKLAYFYNVHNFHSLLDFVKKEKPDLVHLHGFYAHLSPSIVHALKQAKKSFEFGIVQSVHSHELICANSSAYDWNKNAVCTDCMGEQYKTRIFYRKCDRRGWLHSWAKGARFMLAENLLGHHSLIDHFVTPSDFVKDTLIKEGLPETKISVIRNPVILPAQPLQQEKQNQVVYFGRFSPEKNITLLIRAVDNLITSGELPDLSLLLVGEGEDLGRLKQLVSSIASANKIHIYPFQPHSSLMKLVAKAKVAVQPSRCLETASISIPESILMGMLPVVSGLAGMKETIEWSSCGYAFENDNIESLSITIKNALLNYPEASASIVKAQKLINKELGSEAYAQRLMDLYATLLDTTLLETTLRTGSST